MDKKSPATPKTADFILKLFIQNDTLSEWTGDLQEIFPSQVRERGLTKARIWYFFQILFILLSYLKTQSEWGLIMFKNYLKVALRVIKRHKGYSLINIIGLSIGMACCIFILLWIQDELSYDKFHENADEIGRVITHQQSEDGTQSAALSPPPLAEYLVSGYPEIVNATRLRIHNNWMMKTENKKFMEDVIAF